MRSYEKKDSTTSISRTSNSNYVESFDWRNRHGRNWMTCLKSQIEPANKISGNGGCWAFASCATVEAGLNLQFNQLLDYDLSEQELGSCTNGSLHTGGTHEHTFNFIKNVGIITEECMPFENDENISCANKCDNPSDIISIYSYKEISSHEDTLKHHLINYGPFYGSIYNVYLHHAMCLCGYGTVHAGDSVTYLPYGAGQAPIKRFIETGNSLIGKTYWIYKNSYGINNKDDFAGYFCVILDSVSPKNRHAVINSNIHSLVYNKNDIVCEDRDGDGYYFWGLGEKPAHCPSCSPDLPDGDDSDPNLTVMDEYGYFLPMTIQNDEIIIYDTIWNCDNTLCGDILIQNNATLVIRNANITLQHPLSHILIENGATLIVDSGTITNANIIVNSGGRLIIRNNGIVKQGENDNININLGGILQIESGKIQIP